jgi:hypothetical protein
VRVVLSCSVVAFKHSHACSLIDFDFDGIVLDVDVDCTVNELSSMVEDRFNEMSVETESDELVEITVS